MSASGKEQLVIPNTMQGRKWLSKSGGASSNMAAMAPYILPKGGGQMALPLPP